MQYDQLKEMVNAQSNNSRMSYDGLFRAILKRKVFIITTLLLILGIGYIYLKTATPVYESDVLLKKEETNENANRFDSYNQLVSLQSQDDINTVMALINTNSVLKKVSSELALNLYIDKIVNPDGSTEGINRNLPAYNLLLKSQKNKEMPEILSFNADSLRMPESMMLSYDQSGRYILYNTDNGINTPVGSFPSGNPVEISTAGFNLVLYWPNIQKGSQLLFTVFDNISSAMRLSKVIGVTQLDATSLINISVKDTYPSIAQRIAGELVKKFMETRTEQQRQSIQNSYSSIDSQLTETSRKLKEAENELSAYQSQTGLTNLDKNSSNLIDFLSNLEAEKVNNDLMLSQYREKEKQMADIYGQQGYFDQSYLFLQTSDQGGGDSFCSLLKQLSDLEIKRIELLQKETPSHPDVVSIDNQITQIKKQMSSYNQNTLTAFRIIISSLEEKDKNLKKLIGQYQSKVEGFPGKETKLAGLMRDKDVYEKVFNSLLDKREELRVKELAQFQDIAVVDPATLPQFPVSPNRLIVGVLCMMIWGGLVLGYVFIGIYSDRKLLSIDEIEDSLKLPLLSIIPKFPKKLQKQLEGAKGIEERFAVLSKDNIGVTESYKVLQTRLTLRPLAKNKIIMFTSSEENSGKTTIIANLALSLIESGKKVLMIDADLKRCTLSDTFDISRHLPGLSSFLNKEIQSPPIINLSNVFGMSAKEKLLNILPAGDVSENSSDLFQSAEFLGLINALRTSSYDYILIDTPPVTRVIDSLILGRIINNVVMIVRDFHSYKDSVEWGIKELSSEKINIVGVVVNACEIKKSSFKYKYGYGYGYKYAYESSVSIKKDKKDIQHLSAN